MEAQHAAAQAARESFGRLLAWLAWKWGDIAAAEDALADALVKALETWPRTGVPDAPDSWLLTVAKRQLLQVARHDRVRNDPAVNALLGEEQAVISDAAIPDARLNLMFVCAHPAIDEKVRIPLMLQTVLGLQAAEIAPAMLMSPAALAQRLVRAKQKIRDAGLSFETPEARDLPERLHHVLESIYAAFGLSADAVDGAEARITDLREEALYLCELVCRLLPDSPEARGLLALMLFLEARRPAQMAADGSFAALAAQDTALWNRAQIVKADEMLWIASQARTPGPFQLEAAIQSAHCHRLFTGQIPWRGIAQLYEQINRHFPTLGSRVAGTVARAEAGDPQGGLDDLRALATESTRAFQPFWVAKAHLLTLQGDMPGASAAYEVAIGLSTQQRLRDYLSGRQRALHGDAAGTPH